MKNKKIIGLATVGVICTSSISFANDIKILKKDSTEYIPLKKVIQKAGGEIKITNNTAKISIEGKEIIIQKNSSFANIDGNYYPLDTKEVAGFEIPVDKKPLYQGEEIYIEKDFLKENNIVDYEIDKDKIMINTQTKNRQQNNIIEDEKEVENIKQKPEKSEISEAPVKPRTPNKPNKPSNNGNDSSSNTNNNTNNDDNNNENNNEDGSSGNENVSNDNGTDNTGGDTGNTVNGENNSTDEDSSGGTTPETPNVEPVANH